MEEQVNGAKEMQMVKVKRRQVGPLISVFPTCTFLGAARSLAVHPQLADEVLLPELGEPDVPAVVGEGAALEVSVKRCGKKKKETYITLTISL